MRFNPFQSEVKLGTLRENARYYTGQKGRTEESLLRLDGGADLAKKAKERLEELHDVLERERDEALAGMDTEYQMQAAKFAKKYLQRAVAVLESLRTDAMQKRAVGMGRAQAFQDIVDHLESQHAQEMAKLKAFNDALDRGDIVLEDGEPVAQSGVAPTGIRPGRSIADQRRAEDAADAEAEAPVPQKEVVAKKAPKKKAPKKKAPKKKAPKSTK